MKPGEIVVNERILILSSLLFLNVFFFILPDNNILRAIFAFLFLLLVPGASVLISLKPKTDILEFVALSLSISISISILIVSAISYFFPSTPLLVLAAYNLLIISTSAYSIAKKRRFSIKTPEKKQSLLLLFSILMVSSLPVFYLFNPLLTFVSDGWKHISIINEMSRFHVPPNDPRMAGTILLYPWGYHIFVATAKLLAGSGSLLAYNIFSALSILLVFFSVAYLSRQFFKKNTPSILAGVIASSMSGLSWIWLVSDFLGKSLSGTDELLKFVYIYSNSLLSTIPFGPLVVYGMALMSVSIALFWKFFNDGGPQYAFMSFIITGALFTIELISVAVVMASVFIIFVTKSIEKRKILHTTRLFVCLVFFFISYILFKNIYPLSESHISVALSLIVRNNLAEILRLYGIPICLAVLGVFASIKKRNKTAIFMAVLFFVFYFLYNHIDYGSTPIDYRMMYYLLIPIAFFSSYFINTSLNFNKTLNTAILFFLLLFSFLSTCIGIFIYSASTINIAAQTANASIWIGKNTPQNAIFLTEPYSYHTYVSAFGNRRVFLGAYRSVNAYSKMFGNGPVAQQRLEKALEIFNSTSLEHATNIMNEQNISFVFLGHHEFLEFDAPKLTKFLNKSCMKPIYNKDEVIILECAKNNMSDDWKAISLQVLEDAESLITNKKEKPIYPTKHLNLSYEYLDAARELFLAGKHAASIIYSKKAISEFNEALMFSKEQSIRKYLTSPHTLVNAFLMTLSYYMILVFLISLFAVEERCR